MTTAKPKDIHVTSKKRNIAAPNGQLFANNKIELFYH